jgi:hypothetical protein
MSPNREKLKVQGGKLRVFKLQGEYLKKGKSLWEFSKVFPKFFYQMNIFSSNKLFEC